jgi:AcrR family transcriptional regulator
VQNLREIGKQQRRDAVLLAARALVIEGGADALTMRALAARAGVSVPTVYGLIGGRDAVIAAMLERGGEQFDASLADHHDDPVVRIHAAIDAYCDGLAANHQVVRALMGSDVAWVDAPGAARHRLHAHILDASRDAQRVGILDRTCSAEDLATHLDALTLGAVARWAGHATGAADLSARLHHGAAMVLAANARGEHRDRLRRACDRAARGLRSAEAASA